MTRQLNYPGQCEGLEGQVVGPDIFGRPWVITSTYYDAELDRTEAFVRIATQNEALEHMLAKGIRPAGLGPA